MAYDAFAGTLFGLLPIAGIIALGVMLRRRLISDSSVWAGLDRINFFVLIPCLIIDTLVRVNIAQIPIWTIAGIMLGALGVVVALLIVGYRLTPKTTTAIAGYSSIFQTSTRWNVSIALVVVEQLFDHVAISITAVTMVALMPVINIINVAMMVRLLTDRAISWGATCLKIAQNPIILGCLAGLALSLSGEQLWAPADQAISLLAQASFATILLSVGAGLSLTAVAGKMHYLFASCMMKLVMMPLLVLIFGLLVNLDPNLLTMAVVISAMPTAMNGYVLAKEMGGDAPLYAYAGTLQTLGSLITIPVWTALCLSLVSFPG